jgi:hypothetical protein
LFLSQLSTRLGESQVHDDQNDPRFEGLVLENKSKVASPETDQNDPEPKKKRDTVSGFHVARNWREKAVDVLFRPASLLHISR